MKNGQLTDVQRRSFGFRYSFGESHGFSGTEETQLISDTIIAQDLGPQGATLPEFQGIRILLGDNSREIGSFQTRSFTSGSDTDFGAFLSAKEVKGQTAQDGQVVLRMALTDATVVLTKGDTQDPVD